MLRKFLIGTVACVMMSPAALAQSVGTGCRSQGHVRQGGDRAQGQRSRPLAKFNKADGQLP